MKFMKPILASMVLGILVGCGNSALDGEATGQAKKVSTVTPLICEGYRAFDMSMGVMRNGTGSMSTQDMWFTIYSEDAKMLNTLKEAVDHNLIVKVRYNTRRFPLCTEVYILTAVEIVKD